MIQELSVEDAFQLRNGIIIIGKTKSLIESHVREVLTSVGLPFAFQGYVERVEKNVHYKDGIRLIQKKVIRLGRRFRCSRYGKEPERTEEYKRKRFKTTIKCGCKSRFSLLYVEKKKKVIATMSDVIETHNHEQLDCPLKSKGGYTKALECFKSLLSECSSKDYERKEMKSLFVEIERLTELITKEKDTLSKVKKKHKTKTKPKT